MEGRRLTEGSVFVTLLRFSIPFLIANVLQALYGAADLMIVGRFCDAASVCAVATGSQVMQTVTGFVIGLATGGTVLIGQAFGAKDRRAVCDMAAAVGVLFGLISVLLTACLVCGVERICTWMQVPAGAFVETVRYLTICSCGVVFIIGYNALCGVLRGLGDSRTPMFFVAAACIANIFGDLLLVGRFRMGAAGAAYATAASQALSLALAALYLGAKGHLGKFRRSRYRIRVVSVRDILRVGLPIALQDGLINLSFLMIVAIVNTVGLEASAAVGVVEKVIVFSMLPTMAFASAVAAMTAQNVGATLYQRARRSLQAGVVLSLTAALGFFLAAQVNACFFLRLFTNDPQIIGLGASYLRAYSADCVLVSFVFCMNAYFSGQGRSLFPLVHSLAATFLVRIPVSFFMSQLPGAPMFAVGCAAPLATLFSLIVCVMYLRRQKAGWILPARL